MVATYRDYEPIQNEAAARKFLESTLKDAVDWFGEPQIPVREVHIRSCTPTTTKAPKIGPRCQIVDKDSGVFAIYLSQASDWKGFHGQFAHEIAHLLDAEIEDAYIEGLNNVFAEIVVKKYGHDWKTWEDYFSSGQAPLYGTTFRMMKEVVDAERGKESVSSIFNFSESIGNKHKRIKVHEWLDRLCVGEKGRISDILKRHWPNVEKHLRGKVASTISPESAN